MIKHLRKIRQNILSEGKTGKYISYALGEIILVVIGILIALSINNWSEANKLRAKEYRVLKELKGNVETNIAILKGKIKINETINSDISSIIEFIDGRKELPPDSLHLFLERMRRTNQIEYNDAAFQSLKTIGFDLIQSDSLRFQIIDLFDNSYDTNKNLINTTDLTRYHSMSEFIQNHFSVVNGVVVPNDMNWLRTHQPFYNRMTMRRDWKNYINFTMKTVLKESEVLLGNINQELSHFQN